MEVLKGAPPPQGKRPAEGFGGSALVSPGSRSPPLREQALESVDIKLLRLDPKHVAGGAAEQGETVALIAYQ